MKTKHHQYKTKLDREHNPAVEVSWEVCWQLGGIYTVLRSKAPSMVSFLGDRYCLLGAYHASSAEMEFEQLPFKGAFGEACQLLQERGISAYYGRWLITGKPQVVLIDYLSEFHRLNEWKYFLWKNHNIETRDEQEINDAVLFGYLAHEFFCALTEVLDHERMAAKEKHPPTIAKDLCLPIIAHFHEWQAAVAIPLLRRANLPITTVFTTHATLLGRYLAGTTFNLYEAMQTIDPHRAASDLDIYPRYAIERAAAQRAHVFTTVSDITAKEAECFLQRKPQHILPNGLNIKRFEVTHELQNLHAYYKKLIHDFVMGHFFPSYSFDLDSTLYIFFSGRYEYRNKGMDLFIESLARLNWWIKSSDIPITVVAFIITKAATNGLNVDVLKNQALLKELKRTIVRISGEMAEKILLQATKGRMPVYEDIFDEYAQVRLKRMIYAWRTTPSPPIVTHQLADENHDPILQQIRSCYLDNSEKEPVKVVYFPEFLAGTNPILGLDYDQFVRGTHLGVFPSYYEPWGYTPMECVALGIPAITSDLAGFGSFVKSRIADHQKKGLYVLERHGQRWEESAQQLFELMKNVLSFTRRERIALRNEVESVSTLFDWGELVKHYWEAYDKALEMAANN